jgi:hypothetical protein
MSLDHLKVNAGNHQPGPNDGYYVVHSKQFNALVDYIDTIDGAGIPGTGNYDIINEYTLGAGVTIEDVLIKDGKVCPTNGTVLQTTSINTDVTLNATAGLVTTVTATVASGGSTFFTVFNSQVEAGSIIQATVNNYTGLFIVNGVPGVVITNVQAGQFNIGIINTGAFALDGQVKVAFSVLC